jgi:hypothetical protein
LTWQAAVAKRVFNNGAEDGKVHTIAFEDDRVLIQLQAADYLAYEVRRGSFNRRRDRVYVERQPYARLKQREHSFRCYGRNFIANLLTAMAANPTASVMELWFTVDAPED